MPARSATRSRRARTFGFMRDVESLWKAGLALGASLENTVALADDRIMNARACAIRRSSCATRCWMRWVIWRLPARRCWASYRSVTRRPPAQRHVLQALFADTRSLDDRAGTLGARHRSGRCFGRLGRRQLRGRSHVRAGAPRASPGGAGSAQGRRMPQGLSTIWRQVSRLANLSRHVRAGPYWCRDSCARPCKRPEWHVQTVE